MARVKRFVKATKERHFVHDEVDCSYSVFTDRSGDRYLQLDTRGRSSRKLKGKTSQTLQFGNKTLKELRRLIDSLL